MQADTPPPSDAETFCSAQRCYLRIRHLNLNSMTPATDAWPMAIHAASAACLWIRLHNYTGTTSAGTTAQLLGSTVKTSPSPANANSVTAGDQQLQAASAAGQNGQSSGSTTSGSRQSSLGSAAQDGGSANSRSGVLLGSTLKSSGQKSPLTPYNTVSTLCDLPPPS